MPINADRLNRHSSDYLDKEIPSADKETSKKTGKNIVFLPFLNHKKKGLKEEGGKRKPEVEEIIREAIVKYQKR